LNYAWTKAVVEAQFAVLKMIFEVEICGGGSSDRNNLSQGQVVSRKQSNGAPLEQVSHHSFRADAAVVRIRSLEQFVEQKQYRQGPAGEISDCFQACDFGVEAGNSALQRI
jgi:hypothetical protein